MAVLLLDSLYLLSGDGLDNEVHRRTHTDISGSTFRSHLISGESERRVSDVFIRVTLHYRKHFDSNSGANIQLLSDMTNFSSIILA